MTRQYVPNVGDRVKLKDMLVYNVNAIPMWAWLKVTSIKQRTTTDALGKPTKCCTVQVEILNGNEPRGVLLHVEAKDIQKPIGWRPVHTVTCKDIEQAHRVVNEWFKRGIHVWASHDLSSAGRMVFTLVKENEDAVSPHWQYTGNPVETIMPPDCEKYFRVEVLHQWVLGRLPTGRETTAARRKAIAAARAQEDVGLHFVPDGMGGRMALCERIETIYEPPKED